MEVTDGACDVEGDTVGVAEGDGEGAMDAVGCAVGGRVGSCVGSCVRVGVTDGDGDGIRLGVIDVVGVIDAVGASLGCDDGVAVAVRSGVGVAVVGIFVVASGKDGIDVGGAGTFPGETVGACPRTSSMDKSSSSIKHIIFHRLKLRRLIFDVLVLAGTKREDHPIQRLCLRSLLSTSILGWIFSRRSTHDARLARKTVLARRSSPLIGEAANPKKGPFYMCRRARLEHGTLRNPKRFETTTSDFGRFRQNPRDPCTPLKISNTVSSSLCYECVYWLSRYKPVIIMSSPSPFPWRTNTNDTHHCTDPTVPAGAASDLLRRVQDFLPQIQAANEDNNKAADTDNIIIDKCLVPQNDVDESSGSDNDDDDEKPAAKRPKMDTSGPTIQLDLTLGVDANHPAMALLGTGDDAGGGDDEANETDEKGSAEKNQESQRAANAIQSLLGRRNQAHGKAKGPLITEVKEED
eukprot:scaffold1351_cov176-Amphora_coffeaeformis.AAC.3